MSEENVAVVRALIPPPEADMAVLIRDDELFEQAASALSDVLDPDFEAGAVWMGGSRRAYVGIDGFRRLWLDWLEPWTSYHTHVDRLIDAGEHVVALVRDRARRPDSDAVVDLRSGSLWTFRETKIVRVEFFRNQRETLDAAGLEG